MPSGLATLAEVKAILGISGTADDARISAVLDGVDGLIESICGRPILSTARTETHDGGGFALVLAMWPVSAVTVADRLADGAAVAASNYEIDAGAGLLRRLPVPTRWDRAAGRYAVSYTGGEATPPADVKLAVADIVGAALVSKSSAIESERDMDYSYKRAAASAAGAIPPGAAAILARYKARV